MRRWKPQSSPGLWFGIILLIAALAGAVWFGVQVLPVLFRPPEEWPVNLPLYTELVALLALLLLAGVLAYRVAVRLTLAYEMDRNGLYILWLGNRAVVPLTQIDHIDSGLGAARAPWSQGIGVHWGRSRTREGRTLHLFATRSLKQCLLVHTATDAYAISPEDQNGFVQDLEQRRKLGAIKQLAPTVEEGRVFFYAFWNDRVVRWALALAVVLNLILLGVLAARYPSLPATLEMRFNAAGQVAELRPRHQVLFLPLAAFVILLLNTSLGLTLYRREQTGAQLLQMASVLVQVLFSVAVMAIITR